MRIKLESKGICSKCNKVKLFYAKKKKICQYCYTKKWIYNWKTNNKEYYKEYYQKNKDKYKNYTGKQNKKGNTI